MEEDEEDGKDGKDDKEEKLSLSFLFCFAKSNYLWFNEEDKIISFFDKSRLENLCLINW